MNQKLIPYINNLSLEANIPLDLAKGIMAAAFFATGESVLAMKNGNIMRSLMLAEILRQTFTPIGSLLGIAPQNIERALIKATELSLDFIQREAKLKEAT